MVIHPDAGHGRVIQPQRRGRRDDPDDQFLAQGPKHPERSAARASRCGPWPRIDGPFAACRPMRWLAAVEHSQLADGDLRGMFEVETESARRLTTQTCTMASS